MNKPQNKAIENCLRKSIADIVAAFPSIQVMYLFGSHAAGRQRADSDVDIAVFTDGSESPTMDLELGVFIKQQIGSPVDVVVMHKVSPLLKHEVLRNKIRIYERDPSLRAVQEAIAFHEYMDARHYQQKRFAGRKRNGQHTPHSAIAE